VIVVSLEEKDALDRLAKMRPLPSYFVAFGDTKTITDIYKSVLYTSGLQINISSSLSILEVWEKEVIFQGFN